VKNQKLQSEFFARSDQYMSGKQSPFAKPKGDFVQKPSRLGSLAPIDNINTNSTLQYFSDYSNLTVINCLINSFADTMGKKSTKTKKSLPALESPGIGTPTRSIISTRSKNANEQTKYF
jgi:hypothetical protein